MGHSISIGYRALALSAFLALSACASADVSGGIFDPYEVQNRKIHDFNRGVDTALLRPASTTYGGILPEPVRQGVGNFAGNLSIPGAVVNDLLQLNIEDALHNTARFLVNTTIGLGGIFDPAQAAGIEPRDADFGETMHVWGINEGAYIEVPFVGPSTARDTVGMVVDLIIDPVNTLLPTPERYVAPVASMASTVGDRYRYQGTVDSILYESADSYAQSRLLYLDNRRFTLGKAGDEPDEDDYDLYEETYE
ncbi:MAG: VacJ family lipoprotein [Paracoccaceae bacterium]